MVALASPEQDRGAGIMHRKIASNWYLPYMNNIRSSLPLAVRFEEFKLEYTAHIKETMKSLR